MMLLVPGGNGGIVALSLAVLCAPAAGEGPDPVAPLDSSISAAEDRLRAGDMEGAETRYREALFEGWLLTAALGGWLIATLMAPTPAGDSPAGLSQAGHAMLADKTLFLPGATTAAHHQIELVCSACHAEAFTDRDAIQEACVGCHGDALKAANVDRFDLVLSDLGLPDGLAYDTMRSLHDRFGLAGIALSGYGTDGDVARSRDAGFVEHLTKPVDLKTLYDAIDRVAANGHVPAAVSARA